MLLNTCFETTKEFHTVAYYSHLIPIFIGLFLSIYALIQTKYSKLSVIFFFFILSLTSWLLGDLFLWTSQNYYLINFFWSWLDYVNILFFALGTYFFSVLVRNQISIPEKIILLLSFVPPFFLTITGSSILEFDQTYCESVENSLVTNYKLAIELFYLIFIIFSLFKYWPNITKKQLPGILVVLGSILAFFGLFSSTEYIATITDNYEISLYSLFILPLFMIAIVFAITNLNIFKARLLGTQILVYVMIIMSGSQLIFLTNTTDLILNIVTLSISLLLGLLLLQNSKKEESSRVEIEKLAENLAQLNDQLSTANKKLKELDRQKTEFVSMASHQLRTPLTAIKGYSSMLLEGSFGELSEKTKGAVDVIYQSSQRLVSVIEDFLNITRIELGKMKYDVTVFDIRDLVKNVTDELIPFAKRKKLNLVVNLGRGAYQVSADHGKMSQVVSNVIDNAIKYTPAGSVSVEVTKPSGDSKHIHINVKDTGVGIAAESIPKLFKKFIRADEVGKTHITGTGLGLYVVKQILDAHKGTISIESPGVGKGTTFSIVLNSYQETSDQETQEDISEFADSL